MLLRANHKKRPANRHGTAPTTLGLRRRNKKWSSFVRQLCLLSYGLFCWKTSKLLTAVAPIVSNRSISSLSGIWNMINHFTSILFEFCLSLASFSKERCGLKRFGGFRILITCFTLCRYGNRTDHMKNHVTPTKPRYLYGLNSFK